MFTHLEYIRLQDPSRGTISQHKARLVKTSLFLSNYSFVLFLFLFLCVLRSRVLWYVNIKAVADRKISDEITYRWDSNYHNILFPCDPHIISKRKIVELIPSFRTFCDAIILQFPIELYFKLGGKSLRISLAKLFDKCARAEQYLTYERAENSGKCWDLVSNQDNVTLSGRAWVPGDLGSKYRWCRFKIWAILQMSGCQ